jgi:hypothetical protein
VMGLPIHRVYQILNEQFAWRRFLTI